MRRTVFLLACLALVTTSLPLFSQEAKLEAVMQGAFRKPAENGWIFVHLQGSPYNMGFQHGYLLAPEIADVEKVAVLEMTHDGKKDWDFFRDAAKHMMWPHIEAQYRSELLGITAGLKAKGVNLDIWDVVALNALCEWGYYVKEYDQHHRTPGVATLALPDRCSAFVATGSYTKDGKVIIAHNNWTSYLEGTRWTVIFDIAPASGQRILMDGVPGLIHSADDFGINSAGIMITETTISHFSGYNPNGVPEFVRARKAMQFAASIDAFVRLMKSGNNGGYANTWLVADRKTNEIASLELGLKNVTLERKTDGYFVGANFPINPKLVREETDFNVKDMGISANARHVRWEQLMAQYKGKIDVAAAQRFLADHYDTFEKKEDADERALDGHIELSSRGDPPWQPPYGTAGAVQNKVADATMAERMSFSAAAGHACGLDFKADEHLQKHTGFAWEKPLLRDMDAYPWTVFSIAP
ncbi:MAG: C45 family autoproteolytic acyltransferase/hydrolase [Acidobacteriota bacterium]|nr:C45 family autoproteolytic acyltransferase/hydrolase [Acidobacteriota bacterium]